MRDSKLTSKFQTTIPQEIRKLLNIKSGDRIIFEIKPDNHVEIRKATPLDLMYLKSLDSALSEWNSKNDEEDYRDL